MKEWEQSKTKWAKLDAQSYRYWYREKYKIPRVSIDRTDELTEYEFEYEYLLEQARNQILLDGMNKQKIEVTEQNRSFNRAFSMDEVELEHIRDLDSQGEFVDFEIPKDAPLGKKYSEVILGLADEQSEDEQIPVDLAQEFGGGHFGG